MSREFKLRFRKKSITNSFDMTKAVIREGRWVSEEGEPLDPYELNQVHQHFNRIHDFAKGKAKLTHSKIEILTHILDATPEQELAILSVLKMHGKQLDDLINP